MVPVADRPECAVALESAFSVAEHLGANVQAVHIRPHRYSRVVLPAEASYTLSLSSMPKLSEADSKSAAAASKAARALASRLAEARDFRLVRSLDGSSTRCLVWNEDVGHVENLMPVIGPFADLIAVTRPRKAGSKVARLFMTEALLHSSRPVLILPPGHKVQPGRRIVIGWDNTRHAMRSVVAALPFLARADAVTIATSGPGKPHGAKPGQLVKYLKAWGIKPELERARGARNDAVADLVAACEHRAADLLVVGSYSRSRFREYIFGGVTDYMLHRAPLPVFMTSD